MLVNENIFSEALPDKEMQELTREMSLDSEEITEYEVATWLMNELNFVQYGQRYYFKVDDEYTFEESLLQKKV